MKKLPVYTVVFYLLLLTIVGCKKTPVSNANSNQQDNAYAYNLITEANGWHILRKDSVEDKEHVYSSFANPNSIFFANNSIYYSVACQVYSTGPADDIRARKCNLDGSNAQQTSYPKTGLWLFAFNDATTTYAFNRVSLYQQLFNADGTIGTPASERMGAVYFTGKSGYDYGFSFSPAAKCFSGFSNGYTVANVMNMTTREFIQPNDRSEMSYAGKSAFDEDYSKSVGANHYRIFYASKGVTTYTDNHQFDINIHCISDTAYRTYVYNGHTYYYARTVDTIHLSGTEKYPVNYELTADNQNLYLTVIKGNLPNNPTTFSADLIIYNKNTFKKIKSFENIAIPTIQSSINASRAPGIFNMVAVPSKNYVAVLLGSLIKQRLIRFDTNTGTASDITPVSYQANITDKCIGNSMFTDGTRLYTLAVRTADVNSLAKCSNIIYYE